MVERFRRAQESADAGYEVALAELRAGRKRGHWIWYVFPQLAGLGLSPASQHFAIADAAEAVEFLRDAELRSRLLAITAAVAERLRARQPASLSALMGSEIDARKVVSSLTLFKNVAAQLFAAEHDTEYERLVKAADEVLSTASAEGYPPCEFTFRQLRRFEEFRQRFERLLFGRFGRIELRLAISPSGNRAERHDESNDESRRQFKYLSSMSMVSLSVYSR